ncbi:MAG: hypothetical protein KBS76_03490, partial [Ruminococcus sp.]|nr:hypothetical protein [Candidatus Apopatosoma intestinale]
KAKIELGLGRLPKSFLSVGKPYGFHLYLIRFFSRRFPACRTYVLPAREEHRGFAASDHFYLAPAAKKGQTEKRIKEMRGAEAPPCS